MNSVSKIFLILLISFTVLHAQRLEQQYDHALQLYNAENYFDAITEAKRLIFFDKEKQYSFKSAELIAKSYKQGAKFSDALIWFTKAEMNAPDKESLISAKLEKIKVNILRRTTRQSIALLDSLGKILPDTNVINYWKGWSYAFNDEWNTAAEYFGRSNFGSELKLLSDKTFRDKYNPALAKIMSYIVPGSGQFYTGHYLSGLLSLCWNVLWGYTAVTAFNADRVFDGLMVTNFLWLRFYTGNTYNAEQFAIEENQKISNKALDYMEYRYMGEKP